jgi:hypothetical protein
MTMREMMKNTRHLGCALTLEAVGKHYNVALTCSRDRHEVPSWFCVLGPVDSDATGHGPTPDEALHHAMVQQMLLEELAVAKAALEAA